MIINKFKNRKGVSLTLIIGIVSLLMITSTAISELIIANMKSVQRIEASNKAYYLAEAGIEDALYELTPRFPGYETPNLGSTTVRSTELNGKLWKNEWQIESRSKKEDWNGKLYRNEKLMIFLFKDTNNNNESYGIPNGNPKAIVMNAINSIDEKLTDITTLKEISGNFSITFIIPKDIITSGKLKIDNDGDYQVNEDPQGPSTPEACPSNPEDNDCDGLVDEDSIYDTVILWKLTDGGVRSLIPKKGCLGPPKVGSEICEDDFGANLSLKLSYNDIGINQDGIEQKIGEFISQTTNANAKLHFEFLIVAPMEHIQGSKKREIPYIEYQVKSNSTQIPNPYYTIKSDGFFGDFKQSLTAYLTPKTTVPLFDFTIIQQQ